MYKKISLLLGLVFLYQGEALETDSVNAKTPYDNVGLCAPYVNYTKTDFLICKVAGKGDYYYYFSNVIPGIATCAKAEIDEDKKHGSITVYGRKQLKGKTTVYDLKGFADGVILENYTPQGSTEIYQFKIMITDYDDTLGVMAYIRCSDFGKKKNHASFSVVFKESTMESKENFKAAQIVARNFIKKVNIKGRLVQHTCIEANTAADDPELTPYLLTSNDSRK